MKKCFAILIVLGMLLGLAACADNSPAPTASSESSAPAESSSQEASEQPSEAGEPAGDFETGYTIGMNLFQQGAYVFDTMVRQTNVLVESDQVKGSLMLFNDEANMEKITTDVENMINSGVDGAMWWAIIPPHYAVGPAKFEEAGIPFVLFDAYPGWPDGDGMVGKESIRALNTFAGAIGCSNYESGAALAEEALKDGAKQIIIMANVLGSGVDARADGFKEVFEAGGGKVLEVSNEGTASNAHITAMQNLFAAYPDADSIYCAGSDFTLGAIGVIEGLGRDIKVYGTDITPDLLDYLVSEKVSALGGAHWVDSVLCSALLINAIDGHKIVDADGQAFWYTDFPMPVVPAKYAELYKKFWVDEMPLAVEDIQHLLYRYNSEVSAQDFLDFIENYSIESVLKAKYAEGKVTAEELAAVGITVE